MVAKKLTISLYVLLKKLFKDGDRVPWGYILGPFSFSHIWYAKEQCYSMTLIRSLKSSKNSYCIVSLCLSKLKYGLIFDIESLKFIYWALFIFLHLIWILVLNVDLDWPMFWLSMMAIFSYCMQRSSSDSNLLWVCWGFYVQTL